MAISKSFLKGHNSALVAAETYLFRLLPKKINFLSNLLPNSTIDFNLAICEENVVTIIHHEKMTITNIF